MDKGEELPPRYPEEELDFFGRTVNDNVRVGSSSQHMKLNEKNENENENGDAADAEVGNEVKEPIEGSSSQVTDEPEEFMDLRERIYEQNIQNDTSSIDESTPLISQNEISALDEIIESPLEDNKNEELQTESQQLEPIEENEEEPQVSTNEVSTPQKDVLIENTESSVSKKKDNLKSSEAPSVILEQEQDQESASQPVPDPEQKQETEPAQEPVQEQESISQQEQESVAEPAPAYTQTEEREREGKATKK